LIESDTATIHERIQFLREDLTKAEANIINLQTVKLDIAQAEHSFKKVSAHLTKVNDRVETISNQQISLESWVEKYMPLRMQHIITETVGEVVSEKQRDRFLEISREMARVLRQEIIDD